MDNEAFGKALRVARKQASLTQQTLADLIGKSQKMVQHYEGGRFLTPEAVADLEKALGVFYAPGDPVESAIARSPLSPWRQNAVKSEYQRHLHEQQREEATG